MPDTTDRLDFFDPALLNDPYPLYAALRAGPPVHWLADTGFALVSRSDLVAEAAARTAEFSSHLTAALVRAPDGHPAVFDLDGGGNAVHVLATSDEPTHQWHRKLVLPTLVAKRIRALEPTVVATMARLWEHGFRDGRIEWAGAVADRLPMTLVAALIGLPDNDIERLVRWGYASTELLGGLRAPDQLGATVTASVELAGYLHQQFDRARSEPGDDLLGDLVRACAAGELTSSVAVLILVQLVGAGGESSAGLIGNAARLLATDPALQQQVRDEPRLLEPFLEEALRLESPFRAHHRHVVTDTALGGAALPAGSHVLLLWGAANRDPAAFDAPDEVRLNRAAPRSHFAFGKGMHFCVGAALARLEARIALGTLLERTSSFELSPSPDAAQWFPSIFVRRQQRLELSCAAP